MKKENILVICLIALACTIIGAYIYSGQKNIISAFTDKGSEQYQSVSKPVSQSDSKISWKKYKEGMIEARKLNKPLFLYFRSDWCTFCKKMETETLSDINVQAQLSEYFISTVFNTGKDKTIAHKWNIRGVPELKFLKPDGTALLRVPGYVDSHRFLKILQFISSGKYKTMSFENFQRI